MATENANESNGAGGNVGAGSGEANDEVLSAGTTEDGDSGSADPGAASGAGESADPDAEAEGVDAEAAKAAAEAAKKPPAFTEDQLKEAAVKFANGQVAAARRMLRKTEQQTAAIGQAEARAKAEAQRADSAAADLALFRENPIAFFAKQTGEDVRALLNRIATGGPAAAKEPKSEDRISELEKRIADREKAETEAAKARGVEQARKNVFDALGKDERFDLVANTRRGQEETWDAITEYMKLHGSCSDEKVYELALLVERELSSDLTKTRKFKQSAPAAKGASAGGNAGTPRAGSGKTITNNGGADPVTGKPLPEDDDEARLFVLRQLGFTP